MRWLITVLLFALSASGLSAQVFDMLARNEPAGVNLHEAWNSHRFVAQIRIPETPDAMKNAELFDQKGRLVRFRMLADGVSELIIGTVKDGLEIELLRKLDSDKGPQFILVGRQDGQPVSLGSDDVMVTDLKRRAYSVELEKLDVSDVPITVSMAVDVSGSMAHAMADVRQSFLDFVGQLPLGTNCRVALFNHQVQYLDPSISKGALTSDVVRPLPCESFLSIEGDTLFVAGGGTDIVKALTPFYEEALKETETQTLVAVISDGIGGASRWSSAFRRLVTLRAQAVEAVGTYTAVNWLGAYASNYPLSDLADTSIFGQVGNQPVAQGFFQGARKLLQSQVLATPVASTSKP